MDKKLPRNATNVRYKKVGGTFSLLSNSITWTPSTGSEQKFKCLYTDIKVQRISPETSSKVQLQIVQHDDTSCNFHFANPKGREAQLKERNGMKDLLAELIPEHRQRANKDLEEKNKIFKEKPELYVLYKELVVSGIITAAEFWENQKTNPNSSNDNQKQDVGIASGFLGELKPDMHGCNELRFNLTADSIDAIFKMYPAVKKKYINTVPNEVTEKEFWTEFFKSQHFHRDRLPKASSKDVFGELAKKDEQEQLQKVVEEFSDPLIDFSTTSPHVEEGFGGKLNRSKSTNESLIKQFNHQSLMVLQNTLKRKPAESNDVSKKKRIRDAIEYEELEEKEAQVTAILKIVDLDKFSFQTENANGHTNGINDPDYKANIRNFKQAVTTWCPNLSQVLSVDVTSEVIADISPGGKHMLDMNKANLTDTAPKELLLEMKKNYISASELLRHFWSCFPIKTPQLEEKVRRMATSLEKYRDTKLSNFNCMQPSHCNQLGEHLSEMIDNALKKFKNWEERRNSSKVSK